MRWRRVITPATAPWVTPADTVNRWPACATSTLVSLAGHVYRVQVATCVSVLQEILMKITTAENTKDATKIPVKTVRTFLLYFSAFSLSR